MRESDQHLLFKRLCKYITKDSYICIQGASTPINRQNKHARKAEELCDCLSALTDVSIESISPPPAWAVEGRGKGESLDAGQQQPKHWQGIKAVLATDAKHSTIVAAIRKVNSIRQT